MKNDEFDYQSRLAFAERQLDRIHAFFPRLDVKASTVLAVASAEVAVFVLNLQPLDLTIWYICVPSALFFVLILFVGYQLFRCAFPHLKGGKNSLIYFKEIANRTEATFIHEFTSSSDKSLLTDVSGQIWRNSEIVSQKYRAMQLATGAVLLSLPLWVIALVTLSIAHGQMPLTR